MPFQVEDIVFELSMLCRGSRAGKQMAIAMDMPPLNTVDQDECWSSSGLEFIGFHAVSSDWL